MTPLRLFEVPPVEAGDAGTAVTEPTMDASAPSQDRFHASERYLAEHIERHGDLAAIQAVLWLCDRPGRHPADELEILEVDGRSFPRTEAAVARVQQVLEAPRDRRPEGFWPRFLLVGLDR